MEEVHKKKEIHTIRFTHIDRKYFWAILMTFISDVKIDVNMCEPHYVNLFFVNLHHSPDIWHLSFFWHFDTFNLNHLSPHRAIFRWFKFTLKPPYSRASERSLSPIWDTSHWNFFVKFGLRTAWDISYDILLSLLKFVNFWRLQGRLSILAKIGCLQKIKVFSMKERRGFDATWGF